MFVKPKNFTVNVASAGTRQRVVTDPGSDNRYAESVYVKAATANSGNIFLGGSDVSSSLYSESLAAGESISLAADWTPAPGAVKPQKVDLYETYVDTDNSGDDVMITVFRPSEP